MINHEIKVAGYYKLQITGPDGVVRQTLEFPNLITNSGMDFIRTSQTHLNYVVVGSGNTTPAFTDTTLANYVTGWSIAVTPTVTANIPGGYSSWVVSSQSTQGQAAGTLAEVGIGNAPSGAYTLFSRALILDGSGNPTTITVLANEFLTVSYELRLYWPTTDTVGTITDGATTYTVTGRTANAGQVTYWGNNNGKIYGNGNSIYTSMTAWSGPIGAITTTPSGTQYTQQFTAGTYVSGTYYDDNSVIIPIGSANYGAGGIQAVTFNSGCGMFQYGFSPAIAKDNTKTLELHRRISWARM